MKIRSRKDRVLFRITRRIITRMLFRVREYDKKFYDDDSYVISPNHVSNWDTPIAWSLLGRLCNLRTMMMHEVWEQQPWLGPLLRYAGFYPVHRKKKDKRDVEDQIGYLSEPGRLLLMFPDGRHIDPQVAVELEAYRKMIKKGAFYIAAKARKKLVPVFIEPNRLFRRVRVLYGTPIDPTQLPLYDENGEVNWSALQLFVQAWHNQIVELYRRAMEMEERRLHKYKIHRRFYRDNTGFFCKDPNIEYRQLLTEENDA
ncbi:MAG: 1-acyl-sn-glycerol-3-phosphate acyltransferase [Oscillospiraceae bacterium]|jgi:1-acyl-sn-glycerol-3-phosphate acyltransferase|nr:1-acyl-sn-glycerol-3-phosphate acyltransferase [Oscillospiraceae bacterium]